MAGDARKDSATTVYGLLTGAKRYTPKGTNYGAPGTDEGDWGSDNWRWGAVQAANDWDACVAFCQQERKEGLRRREAFGELYDCDALAYRVTGMKLAPGGHEARGMLAAAARASIAYYAIGALLGPRTHTKLIGNPATAESDGDAPHRSGGVSTTAVGHRYNGAVVAEGLLGPLLSWAIGYEQLQIGRRYKPLDTEQNFWPLLLVEAATGKTFGAPTPPEAWGLQPGDREALRALIEQGSLDGLDHAIGMLAGWRLYGPFEIEVRATEGGRMSRCTNPVNSEKPQLAIAMLTSAGNYTGVVPAAWSRMAADDATTIDTGTSFRASAGAKNPFVVDVPYLPGRELWRFRWGGDQAEARRVGGAVVSGLAPVAGPHGFPAPGHVTPPPPPGGVPTASAPGRLHRSLWQKFLALLGLGGGS